MTAVTTGTPRGSIRRWLRPLLVAAVTVALIAVAAVSLFPTSDWLDQRRTSAETSADLDALRAEREQLEARVAELDSDAEIEQIARSQYGLVKPGEEAYAVLATPAPPIELPSLWPFGPVIEPAG